MELIRYGETEMTLRDWLQFYYVCYAQKECSTCIYRAACKETFHCRAEEEDKLIKCKTEEEVEAFVLDLKQSPPGHRHWTLACNGKGIYERPDKEITN